MAYMYIVGWIYEFMWVVGISADEGFELYTGGLKMG